MEDPGFQIASFEHEHEFPAIVKNQKNFSKPFSENSDVFVVQIIGIWIVKRLKGWAVPKNRPSPSTPPASRSQLSLYAQ